MRQLAPLLHLAKLSQLSSDLQEHLEIVYVSIIYSGVDNLKFKCKSLLANVDVWLV